ncbi:hypothetical protein ABEB36_012337 [Hypothenemus hampei]|uniref:UBA domain-containing protein n=1 Tax=Hypothenemus hampei TaxID=57062 RepID=A0ABD1EAW4_HYPHA
MANSSYSDDIKVKISEKYKPPCKINIPMSYSQRLTLNKQLQDQMTSYDFHLERVALKDMKIRKEERNKMVEERKAKIKADKENFKKKIEQENADRLDKIQAEAKQLEEQCKSDVKLQNVYSESPSHKQQYITQNGILLPIPVTNHHYPSSILNPIPTTLEKPFNAAKSNAKSFNLSDFESDTSSPFDNMELKSINDLEELAQVLKSDKSSVYPTNQYPVSYPSNVKSYGNITVQDYQNQRLFSQSSVAATQNMPYDQLYSQVNSNFSPISTTFSHYTPYMSANTYQVPNGILNYNNPVYNVPPQTSSQVQLSYNNTSSQYSIQKSNCKSVPDLVKSVETELQNTQISDTAENSRHSISSSYYTTNVPVPARPKSTDAIYPKSKVLVKSTLENMSEERREVCQNVTLMGFPVERVIRVSETVGCDQKKIVEHLLALSELLDLGFAEEDASEALLKYNNDRDKALDLLIS